MTDTMNVKLTIDPWETLPATTAPADDARRGHTDMDTAMFMAAFDRGHGDGDGWLK